MNFFIFFFPKEFDFFFILKVVFVKLFVILFLKLTEGICNINGSISFLIKLSLASGKNFSVLFLLNNKLFFSIDIHSLIEYGFIIIGILLLILI